HKPPGSQGGRPTRVLVLVSKTKPPKPNETSAEADPAADPPADHDQPTKPPRTPTKPEENEVSLGSGGFAEEKRERRPDPQTNGRPKSKKRGFVGYPPKNERSARPGRTGQKPEENLPEPGWKG